MVRTVVEPTAKQPVGWPGTYPESAASFPLANSSRPVDNEDEWEFEYSTTETEVNIKISWGKLPVPDSQTDILRDNGPVASGIV